MIKYLIPIILIFLFTSCEKEVNINYKETLIEQDWEQVIGVIDNVYYGQFKQFHNIKFRNDNTYEVIMDFGGTSSDPPNKIMLDTVHGRYSIDKGVINFHGPISTVYFGDEGVKTKVFINSWRIKTLNSNKLQTEPIENYSAPEQPAFTIGVNPYIFKPSKQ